MGAGAYCLWNRGSGSLASLEQKPRFLIVFGANGGASIIDSFMAVRESEAGDQAATLNTFPDQLVENIEGTPFRAVKFKGKVGSLPIQVDADQSGFVKKHFQDMLVVAQERTSVTHQVGQKRSLTGNDAWKGRTLQECVALQYGKSLCFPNINMATGGYSEDGIDQDLAAYASLTKVSSPLFWPLGLHGSKGIPGAPSQDMINLARNLRNSQFDPSSAFIQSFPKSEAIKTWKKIREHRDPNAGVGKLEAQNLFSRLGFKKPSGLGLGQDFSRLTEIFSNYQNDPIEGQALLAVKVILGKVCSSVTISHGGAIIDYKPDGSPIIINPPLSFDYSHNAHRATQAMMWQRTLKVIDKIIAVLKSYEFDQQTGESFWDRSLIYLATDFGREKKRPKNASEFASSHHLNNGVLLLSPMLKGNRILGGIDPNTCLTYGFNLNSGSPEPHRNLEEKELFAGLLDIMRVDTSGSGLPHVPVFRT